MCSRHNQKWPSKRVHCESLSFFFAKGSTKNDINQLKGRRQVYFNLMQFLVIDCNRFLVIGTTNKLVFINMK